MNATNNPIDQSVPTKSNGPGNPQHCLNCATPLGAGTWVCSEACGAEFTAWLLAQPDMPDPEKR